MIQITNGSNTTAVKVDYSGNNTSSYDYSEEINEVVDRVLEEAAYSGYSYVNGSGVVKTGSPNQSSTDSAYHDSDGNDLSISQLENLGIHFNRMETIETLMALTTRHS